MRYRQDGEPQPITAESFFRENCSNDGLRDLLRLCCPSAKVTRKDDMIAELGALLPEDRLPFVLEHLEHFQAKYGQSPWLKVSDSDRASNPWRREKSTWLSLLIVSGVMTPPDAAAYCPRRPEHRRCL